MERCLDNSGLFDKVVLSPTNTVSELLLVITLREFLHDISSKPGYARVAFKVELLDVLKRKQIAKKSFTSFVEVKDYSARGAVQSLEKATTHLIAVLAKWLEEETVKWKGSINEKRINN